jgi:hypothetical protein
MEARVRFAVYSPPMSGLPFLAVMVAIDGEVTAMPFPTLAEAAAWCERRSAQTK